MYTRIHEIVYYGKGGYSWETVYGMPIWLRRFTYSKIVEEINKENERNQPKTKKGESKIDPLNAKKDGSTVVPDYIAKASRK